MFNRSAYTYAQKGNYINAHHSPKLEILRGISKVELIQNYCNNITKTCHIAIKIKEYELYTKNKYHKHNIEQKKQIKTRHILFFPLI